MKITRTQEEIKEAISKLKANKEVCCRRTMFGDNNHAAIDAMVEVMEKQMSEAGVDERFWADDGDGGGGSVHSHASDAVAYLRGECDIDDLLFPEM